MKLTQIYNDYLYEGLDKKSIRSVRLWEHAGNVIKESALTQDQITQIFQQVEDNLTGNGLNRTMLGKGKDAASAVNKAWNDLKGKIYNSGPMNNFAQQYDQAAEKLKQATGGDQGAMKYVQKYRDFATKHPIVQGFLYSAMIGAAGISGVGLGGAAAIGLFKLVDQALQGKDIRSAIWSGTKAGALSYGAGQLGQAMKGQPQGGVSAPTPGISGDMSYDQAYNTFIHKFAQDPKHPSAMVIQQAKNFAASKAKFHESLTLSESQIKLIIRSIVVQQTRLDEGVWDSIKQKASTVGKNLTTKITADKLLSQWQQAGSPADSDTVAAILRQAGVDDAVINKVFGDLKLPTPATATPTNQPINIDDIVARIMKLSPEDQQRIIATLGTV
jgi:hypothetical protein